MQRPPQRKRAGEEEDATRIESKEEEVRKGKRSRYAYRMTNKQTVTSICQF
jgi:hypothetical protein